MIFLHPECSFDLAFAMFLLGYTEKCGYTHGHRWRADVELRAITLSAEGQMGGINKWRVNII